MYIHIRRSISGICTTSGEGVDIVELENGCACCNASDELLACIYQVGERKTENARETEREREREG